MTDQNSPEDKGQVLRFRHRRSDELPGQNNPVEDLAKYERDETPDDYRTRMTVNVVAFAFIVLLIGVGYWIADTMANMRKSQDCVLSGRRNCAPVEVDRPRW